MWNIVLISRDSETHKEISALLTMDASLEEHSTLEELLHLPTITAENAQSERIILVDLAGAPITSGRLEPYRRLGIPLVALIGSPAEREPALRAGFDDYLLRPVSAAEFKVRLGRLPLRRAGATEMSAITIARERQAAVGRLTSYFCHAVNNALQAIRGAVDLAFEEPNLSAEVAEYLTICRKETVDIGAKIDQLRQVYRPKPAPPEAVALGKLLHESLKMAADELLRNNVTAREEIDSPLPSINSSSDRLFLALLLMVFHLAEELGGMGGGVLRAQAGKERDFVQVSLFANHGSQPAGEGDLTPGSLPAGLEPARDLILAERGRIQPFVREGEFCLQIRFPIGGN